MQDSGEERVQLVLEFYVFKNLLPCTWKVRMGVLAFEGKVYLINVDQSAYNGEKNEHLLVKLSFCDHPLILLSTLSHSKS